jgi:hypothetical protein
MPPPARARPRRRLVELIAEVRVGLAAKSSHSASVGSRAPAQRAKASAS